MPSRLLLLLHYRRGCGVVFYHFLKNQELESASLSSALHVSAAYCGPAYCGPAYCGHELVSQAGLLPMLMLETCARFRGHKSARGGSDGF